MILLQKIQRDTITTLNLHGIDALDRRLPFLVLRARNDISQVWQCDR